ncbi:MAG TPA: DUF1844 domain-containing protein [Polyangia bacterium]|nr:DUF1844 domain-containing protein [Polyangia bacterium]
MADEKKESKGFTVKDRRTFGTGGEGESGPGGQAGAGAGGGDPGGPSAAPPQASAAPPPEPAEADRPLPDIDFSTFILSLASSAFYHLGQLPHPETHEAEVNLPLAKQTIDILGMLHSKTRGNLSHDEDKLLENILYDLRLKYVETSKR